MGGPGVRGANYYSLCPTILPTILIVQILHLYVHGHISKCGSRCTPMHAHTRVGNASCPPTHALPPGRPPAVLAYFCPFSVSAFLFTWDCLYCSSLAALASYCVQWQQRPARSPSPTGNREAGWQVATRPARPAVRLPARQALLRGTHARAPWPLTTGIWLAAAGQHLTQPPPPAQASSASTRSGRRLAPEKRHVPRTARQPECRMRSRQQAGSHADG